MIAALLGAVFLGGITLAVGYYCKYFGPKSGHGDWGTWLQMLLALPTGLLVGGTSLSRTHFYNNIVTTLGYTSVNAFVNALLGAFVFAVAAIFLTTPARESNKDNDDI